MNRRIIPLIMCGGAGTRLWPASREVHPKQFLPLFGARSTFQETLLRVSDATLFERPIIITNAAYRFMVLEQLAEIGLEADVLLEPMRRDSGPAIAAGAAFAQTRDERRGRAGAGRRSRGARYAGLRRRLPRRVWPRREAGRIVTFGVQPERAGHRIRLYQPGRASFPARSAALRNSSRSRIRRPPADYIKSGYLWNSGNFMFRAASCSTNTAISMPQACGRHRCGRQGRPRSRIRHARCGRVRLGESDLDRLCGDGKDRACRRRAGVVRLVRCRLLARGVGVVRQGRQGNAAQGAAVFEDSRNCNVSTDRALVALEGVDDLVVVATQDAVLVSRQKDANGLKRLVAKLKSVAPAGDRETTSRCIVPGAPISRSTMASATRSSASSSSRASGCRCRSTIIAPSTGSWCAARRG